MSEEKVRPHHLERKALLYVRQSSAYQVLHNEESRRLQYAMQMRLQSLGWNQVEVIDEDLGRSATTTVGRAGFQHLVAEVCLGKVGAVAAREVSRFARNNRDWHQLVEMCSLVDTLLIDHETVYDARIGNDRLLLGLKGSLSEYEIDLLRQRSLEARRQKASRGELITVAPVGYLKTADQRLEKDPDERVQLAVRTVFDKFLELGSVRQTLLWLIEHGIPLPARRYGVLGWETHWKRPSYHSVLCILRNPAYAGTYAYGKTTTRAEVRDGILHQARVCKPRDEWSVLLPGRHEEYISLETFTRIGEMIDKNAQNWRAPGTGAAKRGASLLAGMLRCRRCGRVLMVAYTGNEGNVLRYVCRRGRLDVGEDRCITLGGADVDAAMAREILRVVQPGAVEAAMRSATEESRKDTDVLHALLLEVKAARYDAERARKQFDAVDPENRLVADELERRWNQTLQRVQEIEGRVEQQRLADARRHALVSTAEAASLRDLSVELERVWNAPETDIRLKKRMIRALVEEVVVDVDGMAGEIILVIHWKGGVHTTLCVHRRRSGENRLHTSKDVVEAVCVLTRVCTDEIIAGVLNRNGLYTGHGNRWTKELVTSLRSKHGIPVFRLERQHQEGWMKLGEAASYAGISQASLRSAVEQGAIEALRPLPLGPWILSREALDRPAARLRIERIHHTAGRTIGPTEPDSTSLTLQFSGT
jgi:DNA invertase Pin-like site-specific DNA recombinase